MNLNFVLQICKELNKKRFCPQSSSKQHLHNNHSHFPASVIVLKRRACALTLLTIVHRRHNLLSGFHGNPSLTLPFWGLGCTTCRLLGSGRIICCCPKSAKHVGVCGWGCERMHACPYVKRGDRDGWWAAIINMFLKTLHPIHDPLAQYNQLIALTWSINHTQHWTMLSDVALPRWPNSLHAAKVETGHQYLSYEVIGSNNTRWAHTVEPVWVNRAAGESKGCCFLSVQNICSVVTDKPLPSPRQTQHWRACCPSGLFSRCMDLNGVPRPHKSSLCPGHSNKNKSRGINLPI